MSGEQNPANGEPKAAAEEGTPSHYISTLPSQVKQRIKALKKLQADYFKVNGEFYKEAAALENKYFDKYNKLFTRRAEIVKGDYEPKEEECVYKETNEQIAADLAQMTLDEASQPGVPSFWLTCMKNAIDGTNEFVSPEDEPILEHLTDIVIEDHVDSFKLHFHFSQNEFFTNTVLTKEFKLKLTPSEDDPFNFEGPEITAMKGMKINWSHPSKDVTVKKVTKKQKHKKTGVVRTVVKNLPTDSFFNFFNNSQWMTETDDMSEIDADAFHTDTNLGSFFRERLVPRAVLYFTGELSAFDDDYDEETADGDGGNDVEDDEDDDAESDPDYKPSKKALRKIQTAGGNPECKQQ